MIEFKNPKPITDYFCLENWNFLNLVLFGIWGFDFRVSE